MIVFNIDHKNYQKLLKDFAVTLGIPYNDTDYLILPETVGKGIIKVFSLFDELQVFLIDAVFNERILTTRKKSDDQYYILHFDDFKITETLKFTVEDEMLQKTNMHHSVARLTSNMFTNKEEIPPGVHVKAVKVLFNSKWLKKYLGLDSNEAVLQKYLSLKTESIDIEKLDAAYHHLLNDLWEIEKENPLKNIYLQNRVSLLVERFFSRLFEKMNLLEGKFVINEEDVQRLVKAKQILVNDFSEQPPTITKLSKLVSMSATTLKRKFKDMFGDSIYAYYQKQRLQKAKELLATGKCNVKETAEAIGYHNPSNFIVAFKRHFKILPGDLAGIS
ncbi:MAG: AraC family transcriptional regulator [Bacteroidota bacterium]